MKPVTFRTPGAPSGLVNLAHPSPEVGGGVDRVARNEQKAVGGEGPPRSGGNVRRGQP